MPKLNRFPLLGLWAEEIARRLGYTVAEAESLGHAYAVLYAIRASGKPHKKDTKPGAKKKAPKAPAVQKLSFCGDELDIVRTKGKVRGKVGRARPQTPETYQSNIVEKFPDGYYAKVQDAFRTLLRTYAPRQLDSRLAYELYDRWKKACGAGRMVDLDRLIAWCNEQANPPAVPAQGAP